MQAPAARMRRSPPRLQPALMCPARREQTGRKCAQAASAPRPPCAPRLGAPTNPLAPRRLAQYRAVARQAVRVAGDVHEPRDLGAAQQRLEHELVEARAGRVHDRGDVVIGGGVVLGVWGLRGVGGLLVLHSQGTSAWLGARQIEREMPRTSTMRSSPVLRPAALLGSRRARPTYQTLIHQTGCLLPSTHNARRRTNP
jgi:hypothetical protein